MTKRSFGEICNLSFIQSNHSLYEFNRFIHYIVDYEYNLLIKILEYIFIKLDSNKKTFINIHNVILFTTSINMNKLHKMYKENELSLYKNSSYFYKNRFTFSIDGSFFYENSFTCALLNLLNIILEWYKQDYMLIHHLYLMKNTDIHKVIEIAILKENNSSYLFKKNKIPQKYISSIKSTPQNVINHKKSEYVYCYYKTKLEEEYTQIKNVIKKITLNI